MIVVVDAYNVLKQINQKKITEYERRAFINNLKRYARSKHLHIVVVFDAGPCTWPSVEKNNLLSIVYSGIRLSADDYIRRYIKEHKNKEIFLVTNDQELKKNGARFGIEAIDSLEFYKYVSSYKEEEEIANNNNQSLIKIAHDSPEEVDRLMRELSVVSSKEEEEIETKRNKTGFTPSKKERKIMKKIKKL